MSPERALDVLSLPRGVRPAERADVPALRDMLVGAFATDPVHRWLLPTEGERRWGSPRVFDAVLRQGLRKGVLLCTDDRSGAALWVPPVPGRETGLQHATFYARMAVASVRRPVRALRVGATLDRIRPALPHWYLFVLGVDARRRGHGVSAALMDPVLALCDAEGTLAYLESSNRDNLPVYERRGFRVQGEVPVAPGSPPLWPMQRPPR